MLKGLSVHVVQDSLYVGLVGRHRSVCLKLVIDSKVSEMAAYISAAPLIHVFPDALQTRVNIASQQPCEVGGYGHPPPWGQGGTKRKGLGAAGLCFDLALGHLGPIRPSASDRACLRHGFSSTGGCAD